MTGNLHNSHVSPTSGKNREGGSRLNPPPPLLFENPKRVGRRVYYTFEGKRKFLDAANLSIAKRWESNIKTYGVIKLATGNVSSNSIYREQAKQLEDQFNESQKQDNAESDFSAEIREYIPISFLHPQGAFLATKRLFKLGLPSWIGAKFLTTTIDRSKFDTPLEAYTKGNRQASRMLSKLKTEYGYNVQAYVIKLETHDISEDSIMLWGSAKNIPKEIMRGEEWPHWHFIIFCPDKFDLEDLNKAWGLGSTKINRIQSEHQGDYILKYATKTTAMPEWMRGLKKVQFCRKSNHFYETLNMKPDQLRPVESIKKNFTQGWRDPNETLGERADKWETWAKARTNNGHTRVIKLSVNYHYLRVVLTLAQARNIETTNNKIYVTNRQQYAEMVIGLDPGQSIDPANRSWAFPSGTRSKRKIRIQKALCQQE